MRIWQKLGRSYPPQFELIGLFLIFLAFYLVISNYARLPETIPVHFGTQGTPDGWGNKNSLLIYPIMGLVLYVFFTVMNLLFALVRNPKQFINLPPRQKAALTESQAEKLRLFLNRNLFALKILTLGFLTYSVHTTIEVALKRATSLGPFWFLFLAAIMLLALYIVVGSLRLAVTSK